MTDTTTDTDRAGYPILAPLDTAKTHRAGSIGMRYKGHVTAGFAEIDPTGLIYSEKECAGARMVDWAPRNTKAGRACDAFGAMLSRSPYAKEG